jgi:hypothetical protein
VAELLEQPTTMAALAIMTPAIRTTLLRAMFCLLLHR